MISSDLLRKKILEQIADTEKLFSDEAARLSRSTGRTVEPPKVSAYKWHEVNLDGGSKGMRVRVGNSNLFRTSYLDRTYTPEELGYRSLGMLGLGMIELGKELEGRGLTRIQI